LAQSKGLWAVRNEMLGCWVFDGVARQCIELPQDKKVDKVMAEIHW
jgi:hypothetical protein